MNSRGCHCGVADSCYAIGIKFFFFLFFHFKIKTIMRHELGFLKSLLFYFLCRDCSAYFFISFYVAIVQHMRYAYILVFYAGRRPELSKSAMHAFMVGACKLFIRELNKQTYYNYVLMFQIIRVPAHALLIFIILICVFIFFLFSIFRACCNHCFVLWRHI